MSEQTTVLPARTGTAAVRIEARVLSILMSPRFVPTIVVVYLLMGAAFAVFLYIPVDLGIREGVHVISTFTRLPDESRHIGNILYYAERPLFSGPIITDASGPTIWLGEVERFPSYLYYYVMSFPARAMEAVGAPYHLVVIVLRLLTLVTGAVSLLVVRRILLLIGFSRPIAHLALIGLAFAGAFVWQGAAVSYDMPSLLLFLLAMLAALRFFLERSLLHGALMVLWVLLVAVTKYTYFPFGIVMILGALVIVVVRDRNPEARREWADSWHRLVASRWRFVGLALLLAVALVLFVERIVGNYLVYDDADPDCDVVRSQSLCLNYDIFRRNFQAHEAYVAGIADGTIVQEPFKPLQYTGLWLDLYVRRMFFFSGEVNFSPRIAQIVFVLGAVLLLVVLIAVLVHRSRILPSRAAWFVFGVVAIYLAGVYFFNVRTYLSVGRTFAHNGRYLILVWAFVFAGAAVVMVALWRRIARFSSVAAVAFTVVIVAIVALYSAPIAFFLAAHGQSYYSPFALDIIRLFVEVKAVP